MNTAGAIKKFEESLHDAPLALLNAAWESYVEFCQSRLSDIAADLEIIRQIDLNLFLEGPIKRTIVQGFEDEIGAELTRGIADLSWRLTSPDSINALFSLLFRKFGHIPAFDELLLRFSLERPYEEKLGFLRCVVHRWETYQFLDREMLLWAKYEETFVLFIESLLLPRRSHFLKNILNNANGAFPDLDIEILELLLSSSSVSSACKKLILSETEKILRLATPPNDNLWFALNRFWRDSVARQASKP